MTAAVTDFTQYSELRAAARENPRDPAVLRQVAGQFEALFVQTLLKNMRDTSLGDPIFGQSSQHDMYTEMLDKQLSVEMTRERGFGLADVLVRQLGGADGRGSPRPPGEQFPVPEAMRYAVPSVKERVGIPAGAADTAPAIAAVPAVAPAASGGWSEPADFVRDVWPHADRAARRLGVDTRAVVAQAALETGWGARVMRRDDGTNSYNLFGIKAGSGWRGATVARPTLEFSGGVPHREHARFRAYDGMEAAFDDYVGFLAGRPRYAGVMGTRGNGEAFASALQDAGYATDPDYAAKIRRVMQSDTMRDALAVLKAGGGTPMTSVAANRAGP